MISAPTLTVPDTKPDTKEGKQTVAAEFSIAQREQLPVANAPEISPGAWKVIIWLGVGGVLFLAALAAYVFSGLYRFQNCL